MSIGTVGVDILGMSDPGFEILPHTADMRMRVWGKTLKDLFRNALAGVAFYLRPDILGLAKGKAKERQEIKVEAVDVSSLLIEFLSEVIAKTDIYNTVFTAISFKEFGENFLEGVMGGAKVDGFEKEIKAVSYHEVDIKHNPETEMYETILVFDV